MASGGLSLGVDDDDEGGAPADYPYCEAKPGLEPHSYQPLIDLLGGSGVWLFCTQCGDHFVIDGTAAQGAGTPAMPTPLTPSASSGTSNTMPPSQPKPTWTP